MEVTREFTIFGAEFGMDFFQGGLHSGQVPVS